MTRRGTDRGFTVVVCSNCGTRRDLSVLQELRASIRRCRHGVLVSAPCPVGTLGCCGRTGRAGALVVLQPCAVDRSPTGPPRWVGPISDRKDLRALRQWLEDGSWHLDALPRRLRSPLNRIAAAGQRN